MFMLMMFYKPEIFLVMKISETYLMSVVVVRRPIVGSSHVVSEPVSNLRPNSGPPSSKQS